MAIRSRTGKRSTQEPVVMRRQDAESKKPEVRSEDAVTALRESEARYRAIVEDQTELICRFLPGGTLTFVNEAYCRYFGKKREELVGSSFVPLIPGEDHEKLRRHIASISLDNPVATIEHRVVLTDGEICWQQWTDRAIFDEGGNFCEYQSVGHDITERKRAEELFETLTNSSPVGVYIVQKGRFQFVNPQFEKISGYNKEELLGKKSASLVFREDLKKVRKNIIDMLKGRRSFPYEFRCLMKGGETRWILETVAPITFRGKRAVLANYMDITERKKMELDLLRITKPIENAGNAIAITDEKGKLLTYCNNSFVELFGYNAEELNAAGGMPFLFFDLDTGRKLYYSITEGLSWSGEIEMRTRFNRNVPVHLHSDAVRDDGGKIIGLFGIYTDITGRKQAEAELRAAHQQLLDIIEFLPDATFVVDSDKKVIAWNRAIEEMTGVLKEEIIGKDQYAYAVPFYGKPRPILIDLIFEDDAQTELQYDYTYKKDTTFYAEVFVHSLYGGKGAYLWTKASPLLNSDGQLVGAIESIRDITSRKTAEEQLKYLSLHDSLTGLYNRTYFEEEMIRAADGRDNPVGIVVCDVDGLKLVNDTLGHDRGDSLLKAAAGIIRDSFRDSDMVARIGGDEFAVLLPKIDSKVVERACERIRDAAAMYNTASPELPLSISAGFSIRSDVDVNIKEVFKEADNNMYREKLHRSHSVRSAIVNTLTKALDARDFIIEGHAQRMEDLVTRLARAVSLPESKIPGLRLLAQFHDIGKVGIPDDVLFKQSRLTSEEWAVMQRHSEIGHRIATSSPDLAPIADLILKHHLWWNGEGYPLEISGEEIPLECRILAIADAYDAMTSGRPYRGAVTSEDAIAELRKRSGTQFDSHLLEEFFNILQNT